MSEGFAWTVGGFALLVAAWGAYACLRNQRLGNPLFYATAALEALLAVQLVGGLVALGRTSRSVDTVTFVAYLLTAVLIPPVAVTWSASDRTRWGTAVLALTGLVEVVLTVRLVDIWTTPVG